MNMSLRIKRIPIIAIFAALYVVITLLPGIPIIGGKGKIEIAAFLPPIYGLVLGPVAGGMASWLGAFLAWLLPPGTPKPWGFALTLPSISSSIVAGLASRERVKGFYGWVLSSLVMVSLLMLWYLNPVGRMAFWYPTPHLGALMLLLISGKLVPKCIENEKTTPLALLIAGFPGIMADHMTGNVLFIYLGSSLLGLKIEIDEMAALFQAVLPISLIERGGMTILLLAFGTPLIYGLSKVGFLEQIR